MKQKGGIQKLMLYFEMEKYSVLNLVIIIQIG